MRNEALSRAARLPPAGSMRALLLVSLMALLPVTGALAPPSATPSVVVLPGGWLTQYATPVLAIPPGGALDLYNVDVMYHDVVSHEVGPADQPWCANFETGSCPLFWTRLAGLGEQVPVLGLEHARPGGTYTFYCTKHNGMQGTLVVLPV